MKHALLILFLLIGFSSQADKRKSYDDFRRQSHEKYDTFKKQSEKEYENFRQKANEQYSKMLQKAWGTHSINEPVIEEDYTPTPPRPYNNTPVKNEAQPIKEVVTPPTPIPQPVPIEPIKTEPEYDEWLTFTFFGSELKVRLDNRHEFRIGNLSNENISAAWDRLSTAQYNNVIYDCMELRETRDLCDWAYLLLLKEVSETFIGKESNEATLLMAYIYCQSGYKMKLAQDNERLYMLYTSRHHIFNIPFFVVDGVKFYTFGYNGNSLQISRASFPNEQSLSLFVEKTPQIGSNRETFVRHTPTTSYTVDYDLINFFSTYPSSQIDNNFMTRWAMYANTPINGQTRAGLYMSLKESISEATELEAVSKVLNFVQTAFEYGYDNEIWGTDRAFFAEETLYYPYSDCEDRAILFSRIIRDILKLDVMLVYYPGHLATAVHFTTDVKGDHIIYNNKKYIICDPTYENAPVGATMPQYEDCEDLSVILLN